MIRSGVQETISSTEGAYLDCAAACERKRKLNSNKRLDMLTDSVQICLVNNDMITNES